MPSLVTSGQYCLVKGNGIPFLAIADKNQWVALFSTRHNSAKLILELIWSKISLFFDRKMPWNDGLHMDNIEPLLIAKAVRVGDRAGWMYNSIEPKEKYLKRDDDKFWEPACLSQAEVSAIEIMAMRGGYLPLDEGMNEYLQNNYGKSIQEITESLILTRLFMRDGEHIRPVQVHTHLVTTDDGSGYVCNEIERFDIWCKEKGIAPHYINLVFIE